MYLDQTRGCLALIEGQDIRKVPNAKSYMRQAVRTALWGARQKAVMTFSLLTHHKLPRTILQTPCTAKQTYNLLPKSNPHVLSRRLVQPSHSAPMSHGAQLVKFCVTCKRTKAVGPAARPLAAHQPSTKYDLSATCMSPALQCHLNLESYSWGAARAVRHCQRSERSVGAFLLRADGYAICYTT